MNTNKKIIVGLLIFIVLVIIVCFLLKKCSTTKPPLTVRVNCTDPGTTLANKVNGNPFAKEFIVTGECNENQPVTITRDNVTIRGQGKTKTVIKVENDKKNTIPVFNIVGARGVILTEFTVQDGKQGILVTDGAHIRIYNVLVKDNVDANLCIIGADNKTYKRLNKIQPNQIFEECPLPKIEPFPDDLQTPKAQDLTNSNKLLAAASAAVPACTSDLANLGDCVDTSSLGAECEVNNNGHVNICCADFSGGNSGIISTGESLVESSHPSVRCVSNISNHGIYGISLEQSRLETRNTSLNLQNSGETGQGLYSNNSTGILDESSTVETTGYRVGLRVIRSSTFTLSNNTAITSSSNSFNVVVQGDPADTSSPSFPSEVECNSSSSINSPTPPIVLNNSNYGC